MLAYAKLPDGERAGCGILAAGCSFCYLVNAVHFPVTTDSHLNMHLKRPGYVYLYVQQQRNDECINPLRVATKEMVMNTSCNPEKLKLQCYWKI